MKILTFSTLYPNAAMPAHGIFVETRLRHLQADGGVEARVVAPVPWFPSAHPRFGHYAAFARAPRTEERHGIRIDHPRYPLLPKVGMTAAPALLAAAAKPALERIVREGFDFDVIDAHYFYPDGVAAVLLGRALGKPVVITSRGTDLTLIPQHALPKAMIRWAAARADGLVTVCAALKTELVRLGVAADRVRVLRNGVDLALFHPTDRDAARASVGLTRTTLLSVGLLIPRKGHDIVIDALPHLPDVDLLIAGTGPEEAALRALAARNGVADRVRFVGGLAQDKLREYYNAADALVLASSREGWANVLLEAMACGTPVIATMAGGTPEVVAAPEAGVLMRERTPDALVDCARALFAKMPSRAATRRYAEQFSWDETTRGQIELFESVIAARKPVTSGDALRAKETSGSGAALRTATAPSPARPAGGPAPARPSVRAAAASSPIARTPR